MLKNLEVQKFNFRKIYKNQKIIFILFIVGVILLITPSFFKHKKNKIIETSGNQEFVEKIQNNIADMVSPKKKKILKLLLMKILIIKT